ncbi:MAG: response regulator [Elusimicrobiota bacterium]|nr:response regulator [Elusimicrobiota bacterium]
MSAAPLVLVVDDSPDYRRIITRVLTSAGCEALPAAGAEQARALLLARTPDAAVLDWNMPGENGVEFARWLRGQPRLAALPIIMVSVNAASADQARGLREGELSAYLVKPFEPAELAARLRALLARRAASGERP